MKLGSFLSVAEASKTMMANPCLPLSKTLLANLFFTFAQDYCQLYAVARRAGLARLLHGGRKEDPAGLCQEHHRQEEGHGQMEEVYRYGDIFKQCICL